MSPLSLNFLNFISDCLRVEFLKLLLIHSWTPTYLTIGSKDIYDANSNSLTTVFVVDEHFQDLRELSRPAFQMVLKKKIHQFLKICLAEQIATDPMCVNTISLLFLSSASSLFIAVILGD